MSMAMSRVRKSICLPVKKTIGNECGFSFPVTLCLLMLFVFTLSFQAAQLVAVKGFYKEILQYEKNQYIFLLALKERKNIWLKQVITMTRPVGSHTGTAR